MEMRCFPSLPINSPLVRNLRRSSRMRPLTIWRKRWWSFSIFRTMVTASFLPASSQELLRRPPRHDPKSQEENSARNGDARQRADPRLVHGVDRVVEILAADA